MSASKESVVSLALELLGDAQRRGCLVILRAYVDESGTHGSPYLVLGAYVGHLSKMKAFDRRWRAFLKTNGVDQYHTIDVKNGRRAFAGTTQSQRHDFLVRAEALADEFFAFKIVLTMSVSDFDEHYAKPQNGVRFDSAYGFAFRTLVSALSDVVSDVIGKSVTVAIVVENGHKNAPDLVRIFDDMKPQSMSRFAKLGSLIFADKTTSGLNVADALAYAGFRELHTGNADIPKAREGSLPYNPKLGHSCPLVAISPTVETMINYRERTIQCKQARRDWWANDPIASGD